MRKLQTSPDGSANTSTRPFAVVPDRFCERAGCARKRTLAEGAHALLLKDKGMHSKLPAFWAD